MANLFNSSIGRKLSMALSALFLIIFLLQHLTINLLSVFSVDAFNSVSHFMGYNPFVQKILQPVLLFGVTYHFIMGFILEIKNKNARGKVPYFADNASANSSWFSRNMIWSGLFILGFLIFHMNDFWVHEMKVKYIYPEPENATRYYHEVVEMFKNPIRVGVYCLSFIFLGLHLAHGFQSAFQSVGMSHKKYTPCLKTSGKVYSIVVPALFIFIALYHHLVG